MKRTLIHIPIEPLHERYTEQWYRNFPPAFEAAGFEVITIDGQPLEKEVKVGTFLDINSTTHYKWSQLQQLSRMFHLGQVPQNSVIFFGDIEFWGLEAIRLLADMNGIKVKLAGFLHAASYTIEDAFAVAAPYQQYTEVGWIAALDAVFVGSEYHKQAVIERRLRPANALQLANRIYVSGNPIFLDEYENFKYPKEKLVLLTNRFDVEKRPMETLNLFASVAEDFPDWSFVVCTGRSTFRSNDPELVQAALEWEREGFGELIASLTKTEYHKFLSRASIMVSHSIEENFGYCIAEALVYGCVPLLREGLSHEELVQGNPKLLFSDQREAERKLRQLMQEFQDNDRLWVDTDQYLAPYLESLNTITRITANL